MNSQKQREFYQASDDDKRRGVVRINHTLSSELARIRYLSSPGWGLLMVGKSDDVAAGFAPWRVRPHID